MMKLLRVTIAAQPGRTSLENARTHAHTHTHTHAHTHARMHTHTRTHPHTHACMHTHAHEQTNERTYARARTHARTHAHTHARTHAHSCVHSEVHSNSSISQVTLLNVIDQWGWTLSIANDNQSHTSWRWSTKHVITNYIDACVQNTRSGT